jgi:hypothetical protein
LPIDNFNKTPEIKLNKLKWESTVHGEQPMNGVFSEKREQLAEEERDAALPSHETERDRAYVEPHKKQ